MQAYEAGPTSYVARAFELLKGRLHTCPLSGFSKALCMGRVLTGVFASLIWAVGTILHSIAARCLNGERVQGIVGHKVTMSDLLQKGHRMDGELVRYLARC